MKSEKELSQIDRMYMCVLCGARLGFRGTCMSLSYVQLQMYTCPPRYLVRLPMYVCAI